MRQVRGSTPLNSTTSTSTSTGTRIRVLVDVESGPLEVLEIGRGNTVKEEIPTSLLACRRKPTGHSSKLTGTPKASSRLPKGRLYLGRECKAKAQSLLAWRLRSTGNESAGTGNGWCRPAWQNQLAIGYRKG